MRVSEIAGGSSGSSGAKCVLKSHALKNSETAKQRNTHTTHEHNTQHNTTQHNTQHTTHNTQHTTHNTNTTHNTKQPTTNNQQPTTGCLYQACPYCLFASPFLMDPSGQHSSGAAQRRKQRRLHSWWRHEQQSIAAAGHVAAPQRTAPEDGQGLGVGGTRRSTTRHGDRSLLPRRSSSCTTRKTPCGRRGQVQSKTLGRRSRFSALSSEPSEEAFQVCFRTFPQRKKCSVGSAPGVATWCGLQLIRAGGSSRRAGAVENDFGGAQLEIPGAEKDLGGAQLEIPGAENDFGGAQVVTSGLIWWLFCGEPQRCEAGCWRLLQSVGRCGDGEVECWSTAATSTRCSRCST